MSNITKSKLAIVVSLLLCRCPASSSSTIAGSGISRRRITRFIVVKGQDRQQEATATTADQQRDGSSSKPGSNEKRSSSSATTAPTTTSNSMCNPMLANSKKAPAPLRRASSSFLSVDAFESRPSVKSMGAYAGGALASLFAVEYALRFAFDYFKHFHPLLEDETNRFILARHIGTDALCCGLVAWMGIACFREVCPDFLAVASGKEGAMPRAGFESRFFTYHPAAFRMCLFFFTYQVKNMWDTLIWNDGIEFVAHHLMCMFVAYGTIFHGVAHYYAPFYFGISEISTAVLCLLANFDDHHGVPGLADAFPEGKVVLGALFAVAFISVRVIFWSFFSYYFVADAILAITKTDSTRDSARPWAKVFLGSLTGLSVLQVIWLRQIFLVAAEEFGKMSTTA